MKKLQLVCALFIGILVHTYAQDKLPVRGFCISAPSSATLKPFIKFIHEEMAPRGVNTLILRVDYNYQFESQPELRNANALSKLEVKELVTACRKHAIRLIPQINLLGHQSWAEQVNKLLEVYPQFDETPHIKMPEKHSWPNADGLYCKSYCPLHPEVHKTVFDLVDEICDVFESDAFHAGMDEVFYIGHDSCRRCSGRDKAELFAGEVNIINTHLAQKNRQLWIWGDRLIDGKTTGMGMWEASMNNTHKAIDLIGKDVVICDWHYESAHPSAVYFAMKGFQVITCPWRVPEIAITQTRNTFHFRETATYATKDRYAGMMQTIWTSTEEFLREFYDTSNKEKNTEANCFRALFAEINNGKSK